MPEKSENNAVETDKDKEFIFVCKFCGETKPFCDLVVMSQFFPPISSCKACAKATRNTP